MCLFGGILQLRALLWHDRPFYRTDLQTNAAINASREVDPIPVGTFSVLLRPRVDAGNWAGINAIGNAFAGIGHNGVWHGFSVLRSSNVQLDD